MKKLLQSLVVIISVILSGCSEVSSTVGRDYYVPTIEAYEVKINTLETRNNDTGKELQDAKKEIEELILKNKLLTEGTDDLQVENDQLKLQIDNITQELNKSKFKVTSLTQLFLRNSTEGVGNFVFCSAAFKTEFAYIDKLSMRLELVDYMAKDSSINKDSITSEHHMIWSNTDDGQINIYAGGYMYPYIVRFKDEELGSENSVYSLTSGCYVDFPVLEAKFSQSTDSN